MKLVAGGTVTPPPAPSSILTVNPTSLSVAAAGEAQTFTIASNTAWTVTSSESWCSPGTTTGSNDAVITVTAAANTGSQRTATITVQTTDNAVTRTVTVTQAGANVAGETVYLQQDFNGCAGGTAFPSSGSTDISSTLDTKGLSGWTGSKVYEAAGAVKMGTSSALGWIETPALSAITGTKNVTLTFKAAIWSGDTAEITIEITGGGTTSDSVTGLNATEMQVKTVIITGATANTKIKFSGKQASKGRFFLDDVKVIETP
jgi:hypothetical protein